MTKNQIEYSKLRETRRSNLQNAAIQQRYNEQQIALGHANLQEMARANAAREALTAQQNAEAVRSHRAQEGISYSTLGETSRHNLAYEQHQARELAERNRSALAQEALRSQELAQTIVRDAEVQRHNRSTEGITAAYNRASIAELIRSHMANEDIARQNVGLGYAQLSSLDAYRSTQNVLQQQQQAEQVRHNQASESEVARHNSVQETIAQGQLGTTIWRNRFQNARDAFHIASDTYDKVKDVIPIFIARRRYL